MKTKFSKTFITYFFPVGNEIHQMVNDWVVYLRQERLWEQRCSALSGYGNGPWSSEPVRGCRPEASPLEHGNSDSGDLPRVVYSCWSAILQSSQLPKHVGPTRRDGLPVTRAVQGVEPEPGTRAGAYHVLQLWSRRGPAAR